MPPLVKAFFWPLWDTLEKHMKLRKFQEEFLREAMRPGIDMACLSLPRGNGKSWLAAHLAARVLDPDDQLFRSGTESVVIAPSLAQGRIVFRFVRDMLGDNPDYRYADSFTLVQIVHKPSKTVLQVRSSNAKGALGLVNTPWVILDEPGAFNVNEGEAMFDAISTATGKPGSPLKALFIGTLAPAQGGWWHDLVGGGSKGSTYVKLLQGDRDKWESWPEIKKANPLTAISPEFRRKLLEERDQALGDSRLKARFLSFRLNIPSVDESASLLTVDDWKLATARPVGLPAGRPIIGIDLGSGRAWSAACAVWESGRIETLALSPGIPDLSEQEKRDLVPSGTYQKLVDNGSLRLAEGLRVPSPTQLFEWVCDTWGLPVRVICDRHRLSELQDTIAGACPVEGRVTRWFDAATDIRSLRKGVRDGPFSIVEGSRSLLIASLSVAYVKSDDQGNTRLAKDGKHNRARDDVAAALLLACGAWERASSKPLRKLAYASV